MPPADTLTAAVQLLNLEADAQSIEEELDDEGDTYESATTLDRLEAEAGITKPEDPEAPSTSAHFLAASREVLVPSTQRDYERYVVSCVAAGATHH